MKEGYFWIIYISKVLRECHMIVSHTCPTSRQPASSATYGFVGRRRPWIRWPSISSDANFLCIHCTPHAHIVDIAASVLVGRIHVREIVQNFNATFLLDESRKSSKSLLEISDLLTSDLKILIERLVLLLATFILLIENSQVFLHLLLVS